MNVTATTPAGTPVTVGTTDWTGVTVGTPVLTPSGYVVSVELDAPFAHNSPTGSFDFGVDELTV